MNQRERLIQLSIFYNGNWSKIAKGIATNEIVPHLPLKSPCITIYDAVYPDCLKRLRYPPWVLYYQGDISLLEKKCMTIVGSRELTDYGKRVTEVASSILSRKYVIVSGLAKGADATAHRTAILCGAKTIGVIASGLKIQYPSCNADLYKTMQKEHLIISEYPYDTGIQKHHFAWRNRILAALGEACIVTSAEVKSGTMLTVNEAINLSKDVWCFPYPFESEEGKGCNKLVQEGAFLLYDTKQLFDFVN